MATHKGPPYQITADKLNPLPVLISNSSKSGSLGAPARFIGLFILTVGLILQDKVNF